MAELHLEVVTPEALKYQGSAAMVQLPGVLGEMGILPQHAPLVSMLDPGVVTIRGAGGTKTFAVAQGFATVANNQVVVLVDDAVEAGQVKADQVRARQAALEAELAKGGTAAERARAEMAFLSAQLGLVGQA